MRDSYIFYTDKLKGEYKETFEKIQIYQSTIRMDADVYEDRMMDMLDIFLSAQEKGEPVTKIIGGDVERFCRVFCKGNGPKGWLFDVIEGLRWAMWGFFIDFLICFVDVILELSEGNKDALWNTSYDFPVMNWLIVFMVLLAEYEIFGAVIRAILFRCRKLSCKLFNFFELILIGGSSLVCFLTLVRNDSNLEQIPWWPMGIVSGIYLAGYYTLTRKRRRARRQNRISFGDLVKMQSGEDESFATVLDKEFYKQFQKKNARLQKKGKEPLSWEQFLDMIEHDTALNEKLNLFMRTVFPLIIAAIAGVCMVVTDSFESVADGVIFEVIILVVEYALMFLWWKFCRVGMDARQSWLEKQKKDGDTDE